MDSMIEMRRRRGGRRSGVVGAMLILASIACGPIAISPASAQDLPVEAIVTVIPPKDAGAPRPTGSIVVSLNGRTIATLPLVSALRPLTSFTPLITATLSALGQQVTISYSGDSNYEAVEGVTVTLPTSDGLTITPRLKDTAAPTIDIGSPGDGVIYDRDEPVLAIYSCTDPDDRSAVTTCAGTVESGSAIDTATIGRHTFTVRAADALGNSGSKTIAYEVASTGAGGRSGATAPPPAAPPPAAGETPGSQAPSPGEPPTASAGGKTSPGAAPAGTQAAPPPSGSTSGSSGVAPAPRSGDEQAAAQALAPYDPRSDPVKTIGILVAMFTLLQIATAGGRGLAMAGGGGGVGGSGESSSKKQDGDRPRASFAYDAVSVEHLGPAVAAVAIGDRSRTWAWPGTRRLDAAGVAVPARVAPRSPLLARVTADATYLRAIFGSASLLTMACGAVLGVLALQDTGGEAVPPVASLTIAIAVLGVFDAMAGFLAVLIFGLGVTFSGGIDSSDSLRLMLGLDALWFVVPVLAGAARPLRREPARSVEESWERAADFIIASLIGAWAVQKIVLALPGLAGVELEIADYANLAAYCVLGALVVRLGLETIAAHLYPQRLDVAEPGDLPEPSAIQRLGATGLRVGVFVFFASIVVGSSWQLWVGAALFVIPQVLAVYEDRLPNSPALFRALPKGLVELVLMLFVGTAVGALLVDTMDENAATFIANAFVLMAIPGFLLSLLHLFGRDGDEPRVGWGKRFAGVVLLVLGILLALGLLL